MGDRVSIQFRKGEKSSRGYVQSVVLFSHWDGMGLVAAAEAYVEKLKEEVAAMERNRQVLYPLHRLEPDTVIVDFICQHCAGRKIQGDRITRVVSNYYLGASESDGDNSDNGHHIISLD